jgi:hypothetical protein
VHLGCPVPQRMRLGQLTFAFSLCWRLMPVECRVLQGWCTWDAFYHDVSGLGIQQGLEGFRAADPARVPRWLIIDDGWQVWLYVLLCCTALLLCCDAIMQDLRLGSHIRAVHMQSCKHGHRQCDTCISRAGRVQSSRPCTSADLAHHRRRLAGTVV